MGLVRRKPGGNAIAGTGPARRGRHVAIRALKPLEHDRDPAPLCRDGAGTAEPWRPCNVVYPTDISRRKWMGEIADKIKGNVNEAVGRAKQESDDPATRDEGAGEEIKGKAEQ